MSLSRFNAVCNIFYGREEPSIKIILYFSQDSINYYSFIRDRALVQVQGDNKRCEGNRLQFVSARTKTSAYPHVNLISPRCQPPYVSYIGPIGSSPRMCAWCELFELYWSTLYCEILNRRFTSKELILLTNIIITRVIRRKLQEHYVLQL